MKVNISYLLNTHFGDSYPYVVITGIVKNNFNSWENEIRIYKR